mgnify:CR=1 FL=1
MATRIKIFDTTLRDGEQTPGVNLNIQEKLEIARQLARLGVDVIEAGFAIASPGDFEAVKAVAQNIKGVTIASLSRAVEKDIDRAWEAVQYAERPRIHTFIATSDIHMKYKLKMTEQEVLERAVAAVKYAKKYCEDVEFSPEDAGRTRVEFLYKVLEEVIKAGATVVNIPDTVGYTMPVEFGKLIRGIKENVSNIHKAEISVHCHNDLGLATANSLAAISAGATQIECTINGIGERAGNAALEEIAMALYVRQDRFQAQTSLNLQEIYRTSRLVSRLTGMLVQPNKAIVGQNAFAHEAGIHQDGVLKDKLTYEIMDAQLIGRDAPVLQQFLNQRMILRNLLNALFANPIPTAVSNMPYTYLALMEIGQCQGCPHTGELAFSHRAGIYLFIRLLDRLHDEIPDILCLIYVLFLFSEII